MCTFMEYMGLNPDINLTTDFRINLSKNIVYELKDEEYCSRSEVGREGVRNRHRILTNSKLIISIMQMKSSIQRDLDGFFKVLLNEDFNIR